MKKFYKDYFKNKYRVSFSENWFIRKYVNFNKRYRTKNECDHVYIYLQYILYHIKFINFNFIKFANIYFN